MKIKKWKVEVNRKEKVSLVFLAFVILAAFVTVTDTWGIPTYLELSYTSIYIQSTNETMAVVDNIRENCKEFSENGYPPWNCYKNAVSATSAIKHTWLSTPPKRIQLPAETLERQRGNCVDKTILMATLFRDLEFEHVYLVMQYNHMCVMVADDYDITFAGCIPQAPIKGMLRIYSAGFD